jgi:beta-mannosidase
MSSYRGIRVMNNLSLDGKWDLAYFPEGKIKTKRIVESNGEILTWIDATVPGNCQLDLMRRNHLPDPFVGSNTRILREQEFYEWWYRKRFVHKEKWQHKRLEIIFEGIDTFATIWLNKRLIGESWNMFVPHSFDITKCIKPNEENTILVQIRSADLTVRGKDLGGTYDGMHRYERLWTRKAGHSFGWDICPRIVTTGLWRPVSIIPHKKYEITDFFFRITRADQKYAHITISATLNLPQSNPGELYLEVCGYCDGSRFNKKTKILTTFSEVHVHVAEPRLWWPRDMGTPNLYDVTLRLVKDSRVLDEKHANMGIRTVKLLQEGQPDGGTSFIFIINGERVFAKGSNWVPADAFHSQDMERTPKILKLFSDLRRSLRI